MSRRRSVYAFVIAMLAHPVGLTVALHTGSLADMAGVMVAMLAIAFILEYGPSQL